MKKFRYTKLQKEWLHDLKTTRAKRGEGFLHACNGWCCLGRALHVMGLKPNSREGGVCYFAKHSGSMPDKQWAAMKLRNANGLAKRSFFIDGMGFAGLAGANDAGCTFKQIAAAIEADPSNFFTNGEK